MSRDYFVNTILGIQYTELNILKVLKKGSEIGLIYYDHIVGERYSDSPIINYYKAFEKIKPSLYIPADSLIFSSNTHLYVDLKENHFANLWFYRTVEDQLEIHLGSFGYLKENIYIDSEIAKESVTKIDFKFYIDIATTLTNDFGIQNLKADFSD